MSRVVQIKGALPAACLLTLAAACGNGLESESKVTCTLTKKTEVQHVRCTDGTDLELPDENSDPRDAGADLETDDDAGAGAELLCTVEEADAGRVLHCSDGTQVTLDGTAVDEVCPGGLLEGDYTAKTPADLERIRACTHITGELHVEDLEVQTFSLPSLRSVGTLRVKDKATLTEISLPALTHAEGLDFGGGNPLLANIALPRLLELRWISIRGGQALTNFVAPALGIVHDVVISGRFDQVALPLLAHVDYLNISTKDGRILLPALQRGYYLTATTLSGEVDLSQLGFASFLQVDGKSIALPLLHTVDTLLLYSNDGVTIELPSLLTVHEGLQVTGPSSIVMPRLYAVTDARFFFSHPKLLSAPKLESADLISIETVWDGLTASFDRLTEIDKIHISTSIYEGESNFEFSSLQVLPNLWANSGSLTLSLPSLNVSDYMHTEGGRISIDAPNLTRTTSLSVDSWCADLDMPLLAEVDEFALQAQQMCDLSTTFGLPALTRADTFSIIGSSTLTDLNFPELKTVDTWVGIAHNANLPTAKAQALVDQLVDFDGTVTIEGNAE